jgi:predicted enzyme related to lactoylglutathione lyase
MARNPAGDYGSKTGNDHDRKKEDEMKALVYNGPRDSGAGGTIVYFSCDDCSEEAARAAQSGGQIQRPKFPIGQYGFICFITDTEGNLIGLHSMR